jgi:hypothetical protein
MFFLNYQEHTTKISDIPQEYHISFSYTTRIPQTFQKALIANINEGMVVVLADGFTNVSGLPP